MEKVDGPAQSVMGCLCLKDSLKGIKSVEDKEDKSMW